MPLQQIKSRIGLCPTCGGSVEILFDREKPYLGEAFHLRRGDCFKYLMEKNRPDNIVEVDLRTVYDVSTGGIDEELAHVLYRQ
jgi:hypothetical protein